jgi:hypothetical protein
MAVVNSLQGQGDAPNITALREQKLYPQKRTENRWKLKLEQTGNLRACIPQGNKRASVLEGHSAVMLALYRVMYPKATAAEVNAYLFYTAPPGQRRLYSPSQITRAEAKMGLSRKAGSTTAMQAKLPRNIMKRWQFWNTNYPYGIADIARENLIDVDEAGIFLETCNRGMGKSTIGKRVVGVVVATTVDASGLTMTSTHRVL